MSAITTLDVLARSNSLADLGARIKAEHRATSGALASSVAHSMAAGDLLIEAKALVPHGQWLPWLAANCDMSERTAQLYMRVAKNREAVELQMRNAVADLTLNEAAALLFLTSDVKKLLAFSQQLREIDDPEEVLNFCLENNVGGIVDRGYDVWHGCDVEQKREWTLYILFLVSIGYSSVENAAGWVEWLRQRPFVSVAEWLGAEGTEFRARCWMREMPHAHVRQWGDFAASHSAMSLETINSELEAMPEREAPTPMVRRRRKRKTGAAQ